MLLEQGDIAVVAGALLDAVRSPFRFDERTVAVWLNVGIATAGRAPLRLPSEGASDQDAGRHRTGRSTRPISRSR